MPGRHRQHRTLADTRLEAAEYTRGWFTAAINVGRRMLNLPPTVTGTTAIPGPADPFDPES